MDPKKSPRWDKMTIEVLWQGFGKPITFIANSSFLDDIMKECVVRVVAAKCNDDGDLEDCGQTYNFLAIACARKISYPTLMWHHQEKVNL